MALTPNGKSLTDPKNKRADDAMAPEDEVLMREIDEAVRQDDTAQFFKKYGVMIGSAIGLVLAAFAGYLLWNNYREDQLETESETLVAALDQSQGGNYAAAATAAAPLLDSAEPGPRTSARFLAAAAALEKGDTAKAVEMYALIAGDAEAPQAMRDLATIREVTTNYDSRKPADVIAKLKPLAVPGGAFFGSAGELTALAHLEAGNRAEAGAMFGAIAKDENVPETLRSRARQMAGLLGVDAVEDVDELLEQEGIDPEEGLGPQTGLQQAQ